MFKSVWQIERLQWKKIFVLNHLWNIVILFNIRDMLSFLCYIWKVFIRDL